MAVGATQPRGGASPPNGPWSPKGHVLGAASARVGLPERGAAGEAVMGGRPSTIRQSRLCCPHPVPRYDGGRRCRLKRALRSRRSERVSWTNVARGGRLRSRSYQPGFERHGPWLQGPVALSTAQRPLSGQRRNRHARLLLISSAVRGGLVKLHTDGSLTADARGSGHSQDPSGPTAPCDVVPQPWRFQVERGADVHLAARSTGRLAAVRPADQGGRRHGRAPECG